MVGEIDVVVVDRGRKFLYLRYTDPLTEKRIEKSAKTANMREAEKQAGKWQAGKWQAEILAGMGSKGSNYTWAEFRESYLQLHASSLAEESESKIGTVPKSFESIIGAHRVASVTSQHVSKWQAKLRADGKSEHTISSYTAHLKAAFNWAKEQGFFPSCRRSRNQSGLVPVRQ